MLSELLSLACLRMDRYAMALGHQDLALGCCQSLVAGMPSRPLDGTSLSERPSAFLRSWPMGAVSPSGLTCPDGPQLGPPLTLMAASQAVSHLLQVNARTRYPR